MHKSFTFSHLFLSIVVIVMAAIIVSCTTPAGNPEDGKRWYMMHNCFACHGLNGNDGKGPVIDTDRYSYRKFLKIVRNANSPIMPKFPESKIPAQDVADMYAWLQTK